MKGLLVNYNYSPNDWWVPYGIEPTIYDRSDDGIDHHLPPGTIKTTNVGQVDYDKLSWLVDHYSELPEVFIWGKTNLFKSISEAEFSVLQLDNYPPKFTPLLTQHHKTYSDKYGPVCYYHDGMYHERADSWFFNTLGGKYFHDWNSWAKHFNLPSVRYIPFAPGGNYLLTREVVHKYSRDHYDEMRQFLPHSQNPAEAHAAERSYYLMWK